MTFNSSLTLMFSLALSLLLSGCLPEQRTTQCAKNEAFNATKRACVPVLGAATSNTIFIKSKYPKSDYTTSIVGSMVEHGVAVSDIYNLGYDIKWLMRFTASSGTHMSSLVASNVSTYTFNPSVSYGAGQYILEAVVASKDTGATIASESWTIVVSNKIAPTLINPNPGAATASYTTKHTSAALSVDLSNPDGVRGQAFWVVNGVQTPDASVPLFNAGHINFSKVISPAALGVGMHTVELKITHEFSSSNLYDSKVWIVNVSHPDFPQIANAGTVPSFNHTIIAIDRQSLDSATGGFFFDHDNNPATPLENLYTKDNVGGDPGICVNFNRKPTDADVHLIFDINGVQQGPAIPLVSNTYCLDHTNLQAQVLASPEIGEGKNLTVSVYELGTDNLVGIRSWPLNVMPRNSAPVIRISSASSPNLACSGGNEKMKTGCVATQSADNNLNGSYDDPSDVNNTVRLAIDVVNDFETDYSSDDSGVALFYKIKRDSDSSYQDVDGNSDYTRSQCSLAPGQSKSGHTVTTIPTGAMITYFCDLTFDAFSPNGPSPAGDFTVEAYINDPGSPWDAMPRQSNVVSWKIKVEELISAPVIAEQRYGEPDPAGQIIPPGVREYLSYFTTANPNCDASTGTVLYSGQPVTEGQNVMLHAFARDLERDNLRIQVKMEKLTTGPNVFSDITGNIQFNRTEDAEYFEAKVCFQVPEWASDAGDRDVKVEVIVTDLPDNSAHNSIVSEMLQLRVLNNNPTPAFDDYNNVPNVDDLNGKIAFAGFPFKIIPPTFSDASVYDGNIVEWKWQVCLGDASLSAECAADGNDWTDIPNSSAKTELVWTPAPNIAPGTIAHLRMCLGDNGDGNPLNGNNPWDCALHEESRKTYTNITIEPNSLQSPTALATEPGGKELATWRDPSTGYQYIAYGRGSVIHLEKLENDDAGQWNVVHSIMIRSTANSALQRPIMDLSMAGSPGVALVLAYATEYDGVQTVRVRRIDISQDRLGFSYTGVYSADESVTGDIDMVVGLGPDGGSQLPGATVNEGAAGSLVVDFNGEPAGGSIAFRLASGDMINLEYGQGDWCPSASCGSDNAYAYGLKNAIDGHPLLSQELTADIIGTGTIRIYGPAEGDYIDKDAAYTALGNIFFAGSSTPIWHVAYSRNPNGVPSLLRGQPAGTELNSVLLEESALTHAKYFSTEIKGAAHGNDLFIAVVSEGDLHAYLIDGDNYSDKGGLVSIYQSPMTIKNIDLAVDSSLNTFVAGISEDASNNRYLNAAVFGPSMTLISKKERFSGEFHALSQAGIDRVAIVARQPGPFETSTDIKASVVAAVTTNELHGSIPLQTHLLELAQNITHPEDDLIFNAYSMFGKDHGAKLNGNVNLARGPLALSPIEPMIKGHQGAGSIGADNQQDAVFLTFHESNLGNNRAEIRTGIYNVNPDTKISTNEAVTGSYPALMSKTDE